MSRPSALRAFPLGWPALAAVVVALALTGALTGALAGCGGKAEPTAKPPLRMIGNENMAFLEMDHGTPTGFAADLAAEIARRLGRKLEVTIVPFTDLLPRVQRGEADLAMSAISITPERERQVAFSEPYFDSGQALLVRKDSPVKGTSGLRGATVGALTGSTNYEEARKLRGVRTVLPFDDKSPMFDALTAGSIDAVVCDTPFALYTIHKTGKTRIAARLTTGDEYGIALRKGDTELLKQVDAALAAIRADGTYERLYAEYFGR